MNKLLELRKKAREQWFDLGQVKVLIRRPTGGSIVKAQADGEALIRLSLVGWNLKELDLFSGGTDKAAEFDIDLALDWLEDEPDIYAKVLDAIVGMINGYNKKLQETGKN